MNFTADIKRELASLPPTDADCRLAAISALPDTCGSYDGERLLFVSESEETAAYFLGLCEEALGVRMEVESATVDPKRERDKFAFCCRGGEAERVLEAKEHVPQGEEALVAYLRAAFLGSGSCTLPRSGGKTGYHLEIVCRGEAEAEKVCERLEALQIIAGIVRRGERHVVYLKSREAIADLLYALGAEHALGRMERVSAAREASNNDNRVSNCYASNADKSAIASAAQIVALEALRRDGVLSALPEALRETADARMGNPTLSLGELAGTLGVTKSCLSHRLRKLLKIYGERS